MQKMKKAVTKWLSLALVVAMAFSLNLTGLTVNAATKPTTSTEVAAPDSVSSVKIQVGTSARTAKFYTDDYGTEMYIRSASLLPNTTKESALKNATVKITMSENATDTISLVSAAPATAKLTYNAASRVYSLTCDLLNNVAKIKIGAKEYVIATGITSGSRTPTETGFVKSATLGNESVAEVRRTIIANPCPGNIYYRTNSDPAKWIAWTSISYYINASDVTASDPSNTALQYTLVEGESGETSVDLRTGSAIVTINGQQYTVTATFVSPSTDFVATPENFWIDFREMKASQKEGQIPDATALAQADQIAAGVAAYYASTSVEDRTFPKGTTNMQVLQTILQWCQDNGKFTMGDTTLGNDVTYVAEINGLGEFSVGYLSGWMYTDDPYQAETAPENWKTPAVGGADYVLSPDSEIAWFYTVDYGTHPW